MDRGSRMERVVQMDRVGRTDGQSVDLVNKRSVSSNLIYGL